VERLKTVPLFSDCSTRELAYLSRFLKEVDFTAGRAIVKEGNTGAGLHVLLEGETKVVVGDRTWQRLGSW
jgi:CRP-like cAMP-binding protein